MSTTRLVLIDDARSVAELIAERLALDLECEVDVVSSVDEFVAASSPEPPWSVALVDLSFNGSVLNGVDALLHLHRHHPATKLVVFTQGDDWVEDLLRDVWEALPLATAVSKSMPLPELVKTIRLVERDGTAAVDPVIRPILPSDRSPWRSLEGYGRLVQHAGHAKLWQALIAADREPSYRDIALTTGLSINTVRNYREQLLGELRLHGLNAPTMREMQVFATRCRPFLSPFISARMSR